MCVCVRAPITPSPPPTPPFPIYHLGLWRGVTAAIPRVMVGSAAQLTSFSWIRQKLAHAQVGGVCSGGMGTMGGE